MRRFVLLGLFGLSHLSALGGCGEFGGSVDYLYWKPAGTAQDHLDPIASSSGDWVVVTRTLVDPTYESGVRGEAWWAPACFPATLIGRFYWLKADHSKKFSSGVPGETGSQAATVRVETSYYAADFLLARQLCRSNCLRLDVLAGGHFLYIANPYARDGFVTSGIDDLVVRQQIHGRFSGGGASIGLAGLWRVWCAAELFGELRGGLLLGSRRVAGFTIDQQFEVARIDPPVAAQEWTRELDLRLGGRYGWGCGCGYLGLELGWEIRTYIDLQAYSFRPPATVSSAGQAFGGPFIGVSGSF